MKKFQASLKKNQPTILQSWGYSGNSVTTNNTKNHTRTSHSTTPRKQENQSPTKIDCQSIEGQSIPDEDFADLFNEDIELHENNSVDKTSMKTTAQEVFLDGKFNKQVEKEIIAGFDTGMADTYIYPTNYPVRDYQFNIVRRALLENALVVLPTGLGKTFIASVVMYNFYRWYPNGKLIFMAPTKPLVAQQLEACYRIMGIPQKDTVEMNGAMAPGKRELLWKTRRVFFLTPQVLQNDLGRGTCFAPDVVCLVFDEAHRALGNHAYCQVVKEILRYRSSFRVLALSATPGIDMKAVQQVISNLLISHVEIRSEDNIDIQKYVHQRNVQKIVVPMSPKLKQIKITFLEVLRVFVKRLHSNNALWLHDPERLSKFHLLKSREQWRANNAAGDRVRMHMIEGDFGLCMSLYHAYELLQLHGLISFYTFLKGVLSGSKGTARSRCEMQRQPAFMQMMEQLHAEIEPDDGERSLNESIIDENQLSTKQRLLKSIPRAQPDFESHPKLTKLTEIVVEHFKKSHKDENLCSTQTPLNTRVMIFSQYRDSVQEITSMLSKHEPLVKVMSFIGQGAKEGASGRSTKGLTQKEQNESLWIDALHYVYGEHVWAEGEFKHDDIIDPTDPKIPLDKSSGSMEALREVVLDPKLLKSFDFYTNFRHTSDLESFNALVLKYAPKRSSFGYQSYRDRMQLTAIDHNSHVFREIARTKSDQLVYRKKYNKRSKH